MVQFNKVKNSNLSITKNVKNEMFKRTKAIYLSIIIIYLTLCVQKNFIIYKFNLVIEQHFKLIKLSVLIFV